MRLTNPLWYLAALLIALGSSIAGTAVAARAWDGVRDATVTPVVEPVEAAGRSLAVFTDQVQPDREIVCTTRPVDDPEAEPAVVPEASLDITVDQSGLRWHLIAVETEGEDGVLVGCAPEDEGGDNAGYGYAAFDGFESAGRGSQIGLTGTTIGLVLAGVVFYQRRRAKQDDDPS